MSDGLWSACHHYVSPHSFSGGMYPCSLSLQQLIKWFFLLNTTYQDLLELINMLNHMLVDLNSTSLPILSYTWIQTFWVNHFTVQKEKNTTEFHFNWEWLIHKISLTKGETHSFACNQQYPWKPSIMEVQRKRWNYNELTPLLEENVNHTETD